MAANEKFQTTVITTDVLFCSRCNEHHFRLIFEPFKGAPMITDDDLVWSHWSMCPTHHEPIILSARYVEHHSDPSLKEIEQEVADHLE